MLDVPVSHVWWHRSVEAEIWTWKKPERRSCLWHRFPTEYTSVCWVRYFLFGLVALRQKNQPSPISHIQSAECPQKSLCDSPRNWPRIPKTAICGLSEPNSFGEVVAGSTGKIPGLDDHLNTAGSRMWCYTFILPRCSMYGILTNICPKNHPNVGKYTIHGAYGLYII